MLGAILPFSLHSDCAGYYSLDDGMNRIATVKQARPAKPSGWNRNETSAGAPAQAVPDASELSNFINRRG
jgi:hypothetical protein